MKLEILNPEVIGDEEEALLEFLLE